MLRKCLDDFPNLSDYYSGESVMEEAIATLVIILFVALIGWAAYTDNNNNQARCKSLEMVVVSYAHDSYCAKVEDLKK